MSNPTSNFLWQMPTATDLVTDLPADFEVFGQAVDTTLADLKGGTSGQILAKNTNADMDFVWVTNDVGDITAVTVGTGISGGGTSGAVTITNDMATTITTNGDLIYGTGSGTYTRRGIGSTGNVLTVSGGVPVWSAPAGGGKVLQAITMTTGTLVTTTSASYVDTGLTVTITPSSATSRIMIYSTAAAQAGSSDTLFAYLDRNGSDTQYAVIGDRAASCVFLWLDSPATTSALTYKTRFKSVGGGSATMMQNSTPGSITVMEIGA
jgi:hypothetical protein